MNQPYIIGIAGGTASGKSTLVRFLKETFAGRMSFLSHDSYYLPHDDLSEEARTMINYDCPEAYETELLLSHLEQLKAGNSVRVPVYDFLLHTRSAETVTVQPADILVVEGILIFADERLCEQMDLRIFVDADADVRLLRRIRRDVNKRGRSLESVTAQYLSTVKPMHERYVEPSKKRAHVIIPEGGKNPQALEMLRLFLEHRLTASETAKISESFTRI